MYRELLWLQEINDDAHVCDRRCLKDFIVEIPGKGQRAARVCTQSLKQHFDEQVALIFFGCRSKMEQIYDDGLVQADLKIFESRNDVNLGISAGQKLRRSVPLAVSQL